MTRVEDLPFRIVFSLTIIAGAIINALIPVAADRIDPVNPREYCNCSGIESAPRGGINFDAMQTNPGTQSTVPVNERARNELKHQILRRPAAPAPCPNCVPATPVPSKIVRPAPSPAIKPAIAPAPVDIPQSKLAPVATKPRYNVALFLDGSRQSQQLISWFGTDPDLKNLKANCNFQIYTSDNAIYKSRYADVIPVEYFPAALLTDPNGGHVHLATSNLLPSTSQVLVSDIKEGIELQRQVVTASPAPSIDLPIYQDCVDGKCPDRQPLLRPDRDRDDRAPLIPRDGDRARSWFDIVVNTPEGRNGTWIVIALIIAAVVIYTRRN